MPSETPLQISRADLEQIIGAASEECGERGRAKLRAVAATTDAVAFGWFHACGVACPARQASYRHQGFQKGFDRAMFELYGLDFRPGVVHSRVAQVVG
jgi:hypothetical protein